MRECGFVSSPVVTAVIRGKYMGDRCPPVSILGSYKSWFGVITTLDTSGMLMVEDHCDVYWSAYGFHC